MALRCGDQEELRNVQRDLKVKLKECKDTYRRKLESKLQQNNMREVWSGMKTITGFNMKEKQTEGTMERANEMNLFFNRFSSQSSTQAPWAGPDGLSPRLLRACATQLSVILQHLFNLSLQQGMVPALWKTSCLVPVPKRKSPRDEGAGAAGIGSC